MISELTKDQMVHILTTAENALKKPLPAHHPVTIIDDVTNKEFITLIPTDIPFNRVGLALAKVFDNNDLNKAAWHRFNLFVKVIEYLEGYGSVPVDDEILLQAIGSVPLKISPRYPIKRTIKLALEIQKLA